MALVKSIVFVDGENLTMRFQALRQEGRVPTSSIVHIQDVFLWNKAFSTGGIAQINTDVIRVNYYTSATGTTDRIAEIQESIAAESYGAGSGILDYYGGCQLFPRVFKKEAQSRKSRLVDINITIDIMRHVYTNAIDVVYLLSGDGDFCELANEVARGGKKVCIGAFSSGLEPRLKVNADRFVLLDDLFFLPSQ